MTPSYSLLQITRVLEISLQHLPQDEVPVTALISCNTTPRTRTTSRLKGWHHEHITTPGIKKRLWWEKRDGLHHLWNKWDRLVLVWLYPDISRQHLGTHEPPSYWTWEETTNLLVGWFSMIIPGLSHIFSSPQSIPFATPSHSEIPRSSITHLGSNTCMSGKPLMNSKMAPGPWAMALWSLWPYLNSIRLGGMHFTCFQTFSFWLEIVQKSELCENPSSYGKTRHQKPQIYTCRFTPFKLYLVYICKGRITFRSQKHTPAVDRMNILKSTIP